MKFTKQGKSDTHHYFNVGIKVPRVIVAPVDVVVYAIRKWAYKLRPDKCSCCGERTLDISAAFSHTFANGKSLIVENSQQVGAYDPDWGICRTCIIASLTQLTWQARIVRDDPVQEKCAITGATTEVYKDVKINPTINMTFCTTSWNHDYISKAAVIECVREGQHHYRNWGVHNGKMMQMNSRGLFIDDGKLA